MGKTNRKRGREPKDPVPETLDYQTIADMDEVFSVSNVELIESSTERRPRGRPRKNPQLSDMHEKPVVLSSARRTSHAAENADFVVSMSVPGDGLSAEQPARIEAVARVVPAMDAVVKVFCVHTEPNFSLPWQRKRQYSSSSSGFVIGGRRVLTNAHSVEHYTQVKLKKRGSDVKYLATVLAIGTECDIGMFPYPHFQLCWIVFVCLGLRFRFLTPKGVFESEFREELLDVRTINSVL